MYNTRYISKCGLLCAFIALLASSQIAAQEVGGTAYPGTANQINTKTAGSGIISAYFNADESTYNTTVFTFNDIILFSYFNDSHFTIIESSGDTVYNSTLQSNEFHTQFVGTGTYTIIGSKSYTALVGDAISGLVQGYFAVDQSGRGTSTLLNTFMVREYDEGKFIIFGYEDNTSFNVKNLQSDEILFAGTLDRGENYTFPATPFNTFLQVSANKPVSALSYGDQDYYVPANNGTFSGTTFFGYSGFIGGWTNSITVSSYHQNNEILILNSVSGDTLAADTLGEGQVISLPVTQPTYWEVRAQKTVTVANIPYAGWSGNYYYMTRAMDETGVGSGTLFYVPTISSRIDVFSYEDDNEIKIIYLGQNTDFPYNDASKDTTEIVLQSGESINFTSPFGNNVYKVESTKNVSVLQSNGAAGADFMPLSFAQELPDLAISEDGLSFDPPDSIFKQDDLVTVSLWVHNYGPVDANNVKVELYDGDITSEGTAPSIGSEIIPFIAGQDSAQIQTKVIIPADPEFRILSLRVDPDSTIQESNSSNNTIIRALVPNKDLLPPLPVSVTAPNGLEIEDDSISPNPFTIQANIFNQGTVNAENVKIDLILEDGLSLVKGPQDTVITFIAAQSSLPLSWIVQASPNVPGPNKYIIKIDADNVEMKEVKRSIFIPDIIPPAAPVNLTAEVTDSGTVELKWIPNTEADLSGYRIHYGTSSGNYDGTKAEQGPSPISISKFSEFRLTGLTNGVEYFFALKAIDGSSNLSDFSEEATVTLVTSLEETASGIPLEYALEQNYPNPFNPATKILFSVPKTSNVEIKIYDLLGREISILLNENRTAGSYELAVDMGSFSSGIYIYVMKAGPFVQSRKLVLLK